MNSLRFNPVRLYSIAVAALAVLAHYNPDVPTALYLGVVAALLGVGEGVRAVVVPTAKISPLTDADVMDFLTAGIEDEPEAE